MQTTSRRRISYPNLDRSDRPDVPQHLYNLAAALDQDVIFNAGLDSDRSVSPHQVGGGRVWWATDTHILWYDDGATWQQIGNTPLDSPSFTGTPTAPTPAGGDNSQKIATTAFVSAMVPVGAMFPFAGAAAPSGWLIADGSQVSRTTYAALYTALGGAASQWGQGNGSTTFNLPDLRGRVPVGKSAAGAFANLAASGGEETHALSTAELASHNHTGTTGGRSAGHTHSYVGNNLTEVADGTGATNIAWQNVAQTTGFESVDHTHGFTTNNNGSGTAHNNLQPYAVVNYIIKT